MINCVLVKDYVVMNLFIYAQNCKLILNCIISIHYFHHYLFLHLFRATISNNFTHSSSSLIQTSSTNPSTKSDPSNFSLQHVIPSLPEQPPLIWPKSASQQHNLKQRSSQTQLQQSQQKITSPQQHVEKYPSNSLHSKCEDNGNPSAPEYETTNPMLTLSKYHSTR